MNISNNVHWTEWIGELSKSRKVIAVEMQGHGRTADISRDFSYASLAEDVAALLVHLNIPSADLIGYSMGGGVALQCAILHPEKVRMDIKPYDFGADKLKATGAPMFFIHGDADGVRLEHISEMFLLKGGDVMGDMRPRSPSRLAILPNTTHVTLMERMAIIVPMINDFFDANTKQ